MCKQNIVDQLFLSFFHLWIKNDKMFPIVSVNYFRVIIKNKSVTFAWSISSTILYA